MKKVWNIISKVLSFILSITLFLGIVLYLVLTISTKVLTKENVKELVEYSNINEMLGDNLSDSLYSIADDNNIDRGIIDGVVNSKEFKELLGEYSGSVVENILYGNEIKKITSTEIVNIVEKNLDTAANEMGYTLSKEQKEGILNEVDKVAKEAIANIDIEGNMTNEALNNIKVIRTIFSDTIKIVILVILIVIIVIIALINWSTYKFAIWIGIPTAISGAIFTALGYALGNMITITNYPQAFTDFIAKDISVIFSKSGVITLVIGIIEVVYYKAMKKFLSKGNIN